MNFQLLMRPLLAIILLAELAGGVLRAPYLEWNEIRLTRSLALARGLSLYPGRDALGPIIGTLHTPLSHVFFIPSALVSDATAGLVSGSIQAVLAVFVPLAWALFRRRSFAMLCFLFCAFLIVQSPSTYNVLFMIHADAPAVGLATLACGFLIRPEDLKPFHFSFAGVACAMSLACKQTMAPIVIAVAAYLWLAHGTRAMLNFLVAAAAAGALLLAVIFTAWPARDVLFNIWTLAAARPLKGAALQVLIEAYRSTRLDALPAVLPLLFFSLHWWRGSGRHAGIRRFLTENTWCVFAFCGVAMLPVSIKAMVTVGADINHFGVVLYFFFAAAGLALQDHLADHENPALQLSARLFLGIGILVSLAPGLAFSVGSSLARLRQNPTQVAVDYNGRHPGRAYFPWNPMASFLHDNRLYHLDPALFDREVAGYVVTTQQTQSGMPKHFDIVALPPGEYLYSQALRRLTSGYHPITDPELPGWTVLSAPAGQ